MSTFKINTFIYGQFYIAIQTAIVKREFPQKEGMKLTETLFKAPLFNKEVLGPSDVQFNYFTRKVREFPFRNVLYIELNTLAFENALDYIDEKFKNFTYPKRNCSHEEKAQYKLLQFAKDIDKLDEHQTVETANKTYTDYLSNLSIAKDSLVMRSNEVAKDNEQYKRVSETIRRFFDHLNSGTEYMEAWKLLTPRFQGDRWPAIVEGKKQKYGDPQRFIEGYAQTNGLFYVHVFRHEIPVKNTQKDVIDCIVYYEDEVKIRNSKEFGKGDRHFTAADADEFAEVVSNMVERFKGVGQTGISNIELSMFFKETLSEHIRVICRLSDDDMDRLFSGDKTATIDRLSTYRLRLIEGTWLIDATDDRKTVPIK